MSTVVEPSGLFSREQLAGYDRDVLANSAVTIIGCGAAGNNIALNLALAGVGELRFVDFDEVEASNLTRSPLFDRGRLGGKRRRFKAREMAIGALATSYANRPVARFAAARIEELGMSSLVGSSAVVAAVDSFAVRGLLADWTRMLGVPMVEVGFAGTRGQVSVFSNRTAEEACWRCLYPRVSDQGVSCTLYARRVAETGRVPATQPLAGFFGGFAAEHVIQAAHGRFPLGGKSVHFDLHRGATQVVEIEPSETCPGPHRLLEPPRPLDVRSADTVGKLFDAVAGLVSEPIVHLPAPFVVAAPCVACGSPVVVGRPAWALGTAPRCRACPAVPRINGTGAHVVVTIQPENGPAMRRLKDIGLPAAAIFEIEDRRSGESVVVRLMGSVEDLYETRMRNGVGAARMKRSDAKSEDRK